MYIVTGGAGFIGSAFVAYLNQKGITDIIVVDELASSDRWKNLVGKQFSTYLHKDDFLALIKNESLPASIKGIIHMGACSSTTERDMDYLWRNNVLYTSALAEYCIKFGVRYIYASSAATYGDGAHGYSDDHSQVKIFKPLNQYGFSKQLFDLHALDAGWDSKIVGLKFFNVYGPNEYHKEGMRSMVQQAFEQIKSTGKIKLFKSYRPEFADGEQKRDFIYVKDCCEVMWWLLNNPKVNGIYNLGTGTARSWNDLAHAAFSALSRTPQIEYIEMPAQLRDQYQYFTEAEMTKLKATGCPVKFHSLEDGVRDYISAHLSKEDPYW